MGRRVPDRQDLGVGGRVSGQFPLVVAPGDEVSVRVENNGSDGDVTVLECGAGLLQRGGHGLVVGHAAELYGAAEGDLPVGDELLQ